MDESYCEIFVLFALIRHLLDCISLNYMLDDSVHFYDFSVKYSYLYPMSSEY